MEIVRAQLEAAKRSLGTEAPDSPEGWGRRRSAVVDFLHDELGRLDAYDRARAAIGHDAAVDAINQPPAAGGEAGSRQGYSKVTDRTGLRPY